MKQININLIKAIENNNFDEVLDLIKNKDADIEILNFNNETPIIIASKFGFNRIALLLVSLRVNINVKDNLGFSPLIYACINNMVNLVENILGYPFKDFDQKKEIIEHKNIYGNNALISACYLACPEIVLSLIKNRANVNSKNKKGDTPLIAILKFNSKFRENIVRLLIRNGALVNITNNQSESPIEYAWNSKDFSEITKILIFEGKAILPKKLMLQHNNNFLTFIRKNKLDKL